MDMQERHGAPTCVTEVELVELESADRGKGCKDIAAGIAHGVGHHTTIRETTAVDTLTINIVGLGHILDDCHEELSILIEFASSIPSRNCSTKDGEVDIFTLRIHHDAACLIGYAGAKRTPVGAMACGTVHRHHQRTVVCCVTGNVELILTCLTIDGDVDVFVNLSSLRHHGVAYCCENDK